tara:strand:- start:61 stop:306 length:246 start_codon:yes stop_codon:yes gene_type:complete
MKTKLLALAFLIGCGDSEQTTATTATTTTTEEATNVENTTNTTAETTTKMVEVKKDITADNPVNTETTEENTTIVEGENND